MVFVTLFVAVRILAQAAPVPADLAEYLEEIKRSGASESARSALEMVATMVLGETILTFPKDAESGEYGMRYGNKTSSCPTRELSAEEKARLQADWDRRLQPVFRVLREAADKDLSGFVSTAEGSELRRVYEFGAYLSFLAEHETHDKARLCELLHVSPQRFDSSLASYRALVPKLYGMPGVTVPMVPAEL